METVAPAPHFLFKRHDSVRVAYDEARTICTILRCRVKTIGRGKFDAEYVVKWPNGSETVENQANLVFVKPAAERP